MNKQRTTSENLQYHFSLCFPDYGDTFLPRILGISGDQQDIMNIAKNCTHPPLNKQTEKKHEILLLVQIFL